MNRHLREIIESDCENWNQEIQFYDAMHKIPIYDNSHQFLFEKQAESANIQPKSGSSQEDDDDTVDAEYETIDEVIRISGEIGNARQEEIDALIFDSIESVVSAEFTIEIENDIFTL